MLAGVLGLAFALVWPSLRVFLEQREENAVLQAERDAAQQEVDDLNAQLQRWEDSSYVQAQARERLAYVFPGESPFRVVDPELARPAAEGSVDAQEEGQDPTEEGPWYDRLWSTLERDGATPQPVAPTSSSIPDNSNGTVVPATAGPSVGATPSPGTNVDLGG